MYTSPKTQNIVKSSIPVYTDWPIKGISYKNTVELAQDPTAFATSVDWFSQVANMHSVEDIFAADARGFIWGSATAFKNKLPLHVVRKAGKLPGATWRQEYELEYGTDVLEIPQCNPCKCYDRSVLIVDDVLATGGTAEAICKLLHINLGIKYESMVVGVLINLTGLGGEQRLTELGVKVVGLLNE